MQDTPESQRWRVLMASVIKADLERRWGPNYIPTGEPVWVLVAAFLPAPYVEQYPTYPTWPRAGDVDKFARNVLDALSLDVQRATKAAGAYVDDNQVVRLIATKHVADFSRQGMFISVESAHELTDDMNAQSVMRWVDGHLARP